MILSKLSYEEFTNYHNTIIAHICLSKLSELQNKTIDEISKEIEQIFVDDFLSKLDFEETAMESEYLSLVPRHDRYINYLIFKENESTN